MTTPLRLVSPGAPARDDTDRALWSLVPAGRVVELGGVVAHGRMTIAAGFVRETQRHGALAAWVQPEGAGLYPPDLVAAGVALDALVVVHVRGAEAVARAAELLLRAGGFELAVLDLCAGTPRGEAWVARLGGLARRHGARVLLLTTKPAEMSSSGALVAVRAAPRRRFESNRYAIALDVQRDRCDLACRLAPTAHLPPWEP